MAAGRDFRPGLCDNIDYWRKLCAAACWAEELMVTTHRHADKLPPSCPVCGASGGRRLIYGLVDYELLLELGPGEPDFELGWFAEPRKRWRCAQCGHAWGDPGESGGASGGE